MRKKNEFFKHWKVIRIFRLNIVKAFVKIASTFCQRFCCTTRRRFTLSIVNNINQVDLISILMKIILFR
jgi:hypothetical protein